MSRFWRFDMVVYYCYTKITMANQKNQEEKVYTPFKQKPLFVKEASPMQDEFSSEDYKDIKAAIRSVQNNKRVSSTKIRNFLAR